MRAVKYRASERQKARKHHEQNVRRMKLRITKGDTVRVMRGEDRGKEGKVLRVHPKTGRLTVEGVNIVKRHRRARRADEQSSIVQFPAPVDASNVMLLDPGSGDATRVRVRIDDDGTKERVSAKSGDSIPRVR